MRHVFCSIHKFLHSCSSDCVYIILTFKAVFFIIFYRRYIIRFSCMHLNFVIIKGCKHLSY